MTVRTTLAGLDEKRLRLILGVFFLSLALPTALLVYKAHGQLKWESFHQLQTLAEELTGRIDRRLTTLIDLEEERSFADYGFLVVEGDLENSFLQRSPLSALPEGSDIPGLLGYFQIDTDGAFSTPLLPAPPGAAPSLGIPAGERERRAALAQDLHRILARNRLVEAGGGTREGDASAEPAKSEADREVPHLTGLSREQGAVARNQVPERKRGAGLDTPAETLAEAPRPAQAGFDRLDLAQGTPLAGNGRGRQKRLAKVDELDLDKRYQLEFEEAKSTRLGARVEQAVKERSQRRERSLLPEPVYPAPARAPAPAARGAAPSADEGLTDPSSPPAFQAATEPRAELPRSPVRFGDADRSPRQTEARDAPTLKVRIFESELDPFELNLLESGHFVLFRKVWREGQRYIQGALIEQGTFLQGLIEEAYRGTALSRSSGLAAAYRGAVLSVFGATAGRDYLSRTEELTGALLYRGRLSAPAGDLELVFSVSRLPAGPGAWVIGWLAAILGILLAGGFYALYRLGLRQIALTRQQQDFVSSVSHELKTPLTSIRMYGEMLREGWGTDERKQTYYEFICTESERLSRLINNVLQLARLSRNELDLDLKPVLIAATIDTIAPKLASQVESAGFKLRLECTSEVSAMVQVDEDFLTQILINLVDNGVKFSRSAERKEIEIGCRPVRGGELCLSVRDYGPGIPTHQMKKIFRLFYRSGDALTRETMGTGIGLALVRQLALAMRGRVDVVNAEPGAELRVFFPIETQSNGR